MTEQTTLLAGSAMTAPVDEAPKHVLTDAEIDALLIAQGKHGIKLNKAIVEGLIKRVHFYRVPNTSYIACYLVLTNGHIVQGFSRPISDENFIEEAGRSGAYRDAVNKIWELAAYELRQRIHDARTGG